MAAYGKLSTEFYDIDKPTAPVEALAFYIDRATKSRGRVLEPMCGSGRFLLPMSLANIAIDGVDSSGDMLDACRDHARRAGIKVNLFQQELAELDLPHRYVMAFIPSGSMGLVTQTEQLHKALSRIRHHLEPRGTLLLEVICQSGEPAGSTVIAPRTVPCPDGGSITYSCIAMPSPSTGTVCYAGTYTKYQGTRMVQSEKEELALRLHSRESIVYELNACGFRVTEISGSAELPFLADSGCTLVEARVDD